MRLNEVRQRRLNDDIFDLLKLLLPVAHDFEI